MTSDGHEVPTCAFEETWSSIQRFKRHICSKFQIVPKWVPRNDIILSSVTRPRANSNDRFEVLMFLELSGR